MDSILNKLMVMFNSIVAEYGIEGAIGRGIGSLICCCLIGSIWEK